MKIPKRMVLIPLLVLVALVPAVAGQATFPMLLYGEVINDDTMEHAPPGTVIIIETDEGETVQDTVEDNGRYGPVRDRLAVPECQTFDVFVKIDGKKLHLGTVNWKEGEVTQMDLHYTTTGIAKEGETNEGGGTETDVSTSSTGGLIVFQESDSTTTSDSTSETSGSGGGTTSGTSSSEETPEAATTSGSEGQTDTGTTPQSEEPSQTGLPTNLILMFVLAITVVVIVIYAVRNR